MQRPDIDMIFGPWAKVVCMVARMELGTGLVGCKLAGGVAVQWWGLAVADRVRVTSDVGASTKLGECPRA